tara:strand:- start:820 stop:1818 length:999 start_codon:yes stop_codon:yes gene_type:complete
MGEHLYNAPPTFIWRIYESILQSITTKLWRSIMLDTKTYEKELQKVNFPVEIQDIHDIPVEMARKIVRVDTNEPLGLVKSKYKPIDHVQAFDGAIQQMQNGGLNFTDAKINIDAYENGAMAKMEVLLPSHHTKIGTHDLFLKYVARNSYNGRWKFQAFFGWLNEVCFNTLVTGQKLAYTSNRHTKSFDIDASNQKIKNAVQAVTDETEKFTKWWNTPVEDNQIKKLFERTIAKMPLSEGSKLAGASQMNKKQLYNLMGLYNDEVAQLHGKGDYGRKNAKGSLWCAYQSATAWSTHLSDVQKDESKKHIVQEQRQNSVIKMLNSPQWQKLETV